MSHPNLVARGLLNRISETVRRSLDTLYVLPREMRAPAPLPSRFGSLFACPSPSSLLHAVFPQ